MITPINPVPSPITAQSLATSGFTIQEQPMSETDYQALKMGFASLIHLMIAKMLRGTGLRIGEGLAFEPRHTFLHPPSYHILILRSKKRQRAAVPEYEPVFIPPTLGMELASYIQGNGIRIDEPIFQGRKRGSKITQRAVRYAFDKASDQAFQYGLHRRIHPHDIRHLFALYLRDQGVPVEVTAKLLGHEDPKTTYQWYHDLTVDERKGIGERIPV